MTSAPPWLVFLLGTMGLACAPEPPPRSVPRSPPPRVPSDAEPPTPTVPSCSEVPCAAPGADQPRWGDSPRREQLRGRVLDDRGEPVFARVAVFDFPPEVCTAGEDCESGVFTAAGGTGPDGSFSFPVPAPAGDGSTSRSIVVESRGGFRVLRHDDLPAEIVVEPVRALPVVLHLSEPPTDGVRVRIEIERGARGASERWARYFLTHRGGLAHPGLISSSRGLLSVSADGPVLRATVLVPVGEVRVGAIVERWSTLGPDGRVNEAPPYGAAIDDLELQVPRGEGLLAEQTLSTPRPDAVLLTIRHRPRRPALCTRWSTQLRHAGGIENVIAADIAAGSRGAYRFAVPAGTYEIGITPECRETVELRAGHPRTVTLRRECGVTCVPEHPFCGVGFHVPPAGVEP